MFTINNARLTDDGASKGSIEVRKAADFVVLSGDVMTVPAREVERLKALATFVGGRKVHQDPGMAL
jgi:predicted amidohydrolase YtcJ